MPSSYCSLTHGKRYEINRRFSNISGFMKTYGSDSGGRSDRLFVSVLRGCLATSSGVEWMKDVCVKGRLYDSLLSSTRSAQRCGISRRFRRAFHWRRTAAHEPRWFYYLGTPDHVFIFSCSFSHFQSLDHFPSALISVRNKLANIGFNSAEVWLPKFLEARRPAVLMISIDCSKTRSVDLFGRNDAQNFFSFRIEALRRFTDNWEPLRFKSFCLQIISFW